jgi:hypothetical protein
MEVHGFYVHPVTGLLCEVTARKYRYDKAAYQLRQTLARYELPTLTWKQKVALRGDWDRPLPKVADWIIVSPLLILERRGTLWFGHHFQALDPMEKVGTKTVHGREVDVLRMDLKGSPYKKLRVEQIGRKHPLWDRCKEAA